VSRTGLPFFFMDATTFIVSLNPHSDHASFICITKSVEKEAAFGLFNAH
jgi:hypothetical protein